MNFLFNDDMCLKVCVHCPVIQGPKIITCLIKKIKNLNRQVLRVFFFFFEHRKRWNNFLLVYRRLPLSTE
jgi:hypothetical protein